MANQAEIRRNQRRANRTGIDDGDVVINDYEDSKAIKPAIPLSTKGTSDVRLSLKDIQKNVSEQAPTSFYRHISEPDAIGPHVPYVESTVGSQQPQQVPAVVTDGKPFAQTLQNLQEGIKTQLESKPSNRPFLGQIGEFFNERAHEVRETFGFDPKAPLSMNDVSMLASIVAGAVKPNDPQAQKLYENAMANKEALSPDNIYKEALSRLQAEATVKQSLVKSEYADANAQADLTAKYQQNTYMPLLSEEQLERAKIDNLYRAETNEATLQKYADDHNMHIEQLGGLGQEAVKDLDPVTFGQMLTDAKKQRASIARATGLTDDFTISPLTGDITWMGVPTFNIASKYLKEYIPRKAFEPTGVTPNAVGLYRQAFDAEVGPMVDALLTEPIDGTDMNTITDQGLIDAILPAFFDDPKFFDSVAYIGIRPRADGTFDILPYVRGKDGGFVSVDDAEDADGNKIKVDIEAYTREELLQGLKSGIFKR